MSHVVGTFFQDEAWRRLATETDELVRELVEASGPAKLMREQKLRLFKLRIGHLRLRLATLKQGLHQYLACKEERLLINSDDEDARYNLTLGAERLADMWLMESLLERLVASPVRDAASQLASRASSSSSEAGT